ncbi:MAG: class I SAM-dependent methyltransferase [Isosphaeraceae bacterium]
MNTTVTTNETLAEPWEIRKPAEANQPVDWSRTRPRLLSYVGRWGRARRWLPEDARSVLDVGCAFGYGTVAIVAGTESHRWIVGVERDQRNVEIAAERYPWLSMVRADARSLPFLDGTIDAVVSLDVLEHLDDPMAVVEEVRRVLRPGGAFIVSVPQRGILARFDSNNVYSWLRSWFRWFLPLEECEESASGHHKHFNKSELMVLLGNGFVVDRWTGSGLGLAELLHVAIAVVFKGLLRWRGAYMVLRHLYFIAFLLEDLIPSGRFGYTLTVRARAARVAPR